MSDVEIDACCVLLSFLPLFEYFLALPSLLSSAISVTFLHLCNYCLRLLYLLEYC